MCLGVLPQVHDPEGGYQGRLHYSQTGIIQLLQRRTICYWYISSPVGTIGTIFWIAFKIIVGNPWNFGADPDPRIVPLTNGSNSVSDSFFQWLQGCQKNFFSIYFSFYLPAGTLSSVFCKHYFSPFNTFLKKGRIRIRIRTFDGWIRILEAQKHADPDPQHCLKKCCYFQVMEEKLNETNVEAARATPDGGFQLIKVCPHLE